MDVRDTNKIKYHETIDQYQNWNMLKHLEEEIHINIHTCPDIMIWYIVVDDNTVHLPCYSGWGDSFCMACYCEVKVIYVQIEV